jgi:hypothetical protein
MEPDDSTPVLEINALIGVEIKKHVEGELWQTSMCQANG